MVLLYKRYIATFLLALGLLMLSIGDAQAVMPLSNEGLSDSATSVQIDVMEVTLQDPVASYSGKQIQKSDFLDFIEASTGLRPETYPSIESLKEAILSYILYTDFTAQGRALASEDNRVASLELGILRTQLLADMMMQEGNPPSAEELAAQIATIKLDLTDVERYFITQQSQPHLSAEEIKKVPDLQKIAIEDFKETLAYAAMAKNAKMDLRPEYALRVKWAEMKYFSQHYIEDYIARLPQDKADIAASFATWKSKQDFSKYKVSHIYLDNLAQAEDVLEKIKEKTLRFADAVKEFSLDTKTHNSDGKLNDGDWVTFMYTDHPFSKAVSQLSVGELAPIVVKGVEGYHIILLEDKQAGEAPDYSHSEKFQHFIWREDQLMQMYQNLREEMSIEIY